MSNACSCRGRVTCDAAAKVRCRSRSRCATIGPFLNHDTAGAPMSAKTTYLVSIFIGAPTEQHRKIKDIAAHVSGGDYEFLHLHQMGAFLVLNTDKGARDLSKAFAPATASDDRLFICEIGQDWQALGLNKA